jgi:glycosyltransferase involved in cell wall biosynthesis
VASRVRSTSPVKILVVNDYATPSGGAEFLTFALRDGLRRRGHDARLLASSAGRTDAGSPEQSPPDYETFGTVSRFRTLLQTANPWAAARLRQVLSEFRPDVVHVRMFLTQLSPLILPLLKEVPSLYHVVWYRPICPIGTKMLPDGSICRVPAGLVCYREGCVPLRDWGPLMAQLRLWRRWREAFDMVVANSEAVRRRLLAEGIDPVEVVWNGVPVRPPRTSLSPTPTVLFAGRLVPEKGPDVAVQAFAQVARELPEALLVLAGDGPAAPGLRALIAELGLEDRVLMPGWLPHAELERRFGDAWVQAVPSRWQEPFGAVAAEAMMRGTAVVASASGGLPEIVQHEQSGLLVPTGDVAALAAALTRLLRDRELASGFGMAGRDIALARFSEDAYVDGHLRLYERLRSAR